MDFEWLPGGKFFLPPILSYVRGECMKKRIACLLIASLLLISNVITPVYATDLPLQESSAEAQESLQESNQNDKSDGTKESGGESGDSLEGERESSADVDAREEEASADSGQSKEETPEEAKDAEEADTNKGTEELSQGEESSEKESIEESGKEIEKDEEETSKDASEPASEPVSGPDAQEAGSVEPVVVDNAGQIDVSIGAALILGSEVEFTVALSGADQKEEQTLVLSPDSTEAKKVSFEGLKAGDYTVKVSAPGFAAYSQTISVDQKGYEIKLMTGFLAGMSYEKGQLHPGVLLPGDVNGDGVIDDKDKQVLVDDIDAGKDTNDGRSDLSRDGEVNLVDLEYFAKGYQRTEDLQAAIEEFISSAIVQLAAVEGTTVEGDVHELLSGEASVTMAPVNGSAISADNPVSMEFDFNAVSEKDGRMEFPVMDGIIIGTGTEENQVSEAEITITYLDDDGSEQTITVPATAGVDYLLRNTSVSAVIDGDGTIQVNLGTQIAVKKVTITIKGMQKNTNLAEISRVEFVNGMEERIPEPEMDIPKNLKADAGNKLITLSWDACANITGYEVWVNLEGQPDSKAETTLVSNHSMVISSYGGKELENLKTYVIKVQSVNGTWRSGYCSEVEATPQPTGRPDKPDNVTAAGKYKSIAVSWKAMKDTETYNLYYKESSDETAEYTKIEGLTANKYTISDLKALTDYTVYVTGVNSYGESDPSLTSIARTTDLNPAVVPKYGLINTGEEGEVSEHIISVTRNGGEMKDSPLDTETGTAWGVVDKDAASYYYKNSWDDGGYNALGQNGLTFEFDQAYYMDTIRVIPAQGYEYFYVRMAWWDEDGKRTEVARTTLSKSTDSEGRIFYVLKLPNPGNVKKIQIGLGQYSTSTRTAVAEVYFYHYDTLMDEIMNLYEDDLHTMLKDTTTQETIDALRTRVNTVDEVSQEYNPNRTALLRELDTAEKILQDGKLKDVDSVAIHTGITTNDVSRGFGGLNAWQPLGVTAAVGEEITIYVGHNTKKTGDSTDLRMVMTQYHSESNAVTIDGANLKVGANTFTVTKGKLADVESGGSIYIQYQGNNANDRYAVRVSGGTQVPRLDLYQVTDEAERLAAAKTYVEALERYVPSIEALHNEIHKGSSNVCLNFDYDEKNCILGASDILLDTMMFSLPAQQIWKGLGSGDADAKAQRLVDSMDAMEEMMELFYQHKGLNASASQAKDQIPKGHQNIRYQRMFSGAFMYASGNHIGIEWSEAPGMMNGVPMETDENGKYISGSYFGWGIGHEIGHCINQDSYAVAEITNNYFAQLAQAKDTNEGMRFQYQNIYDKVTSGTTGSSSNGATQLGLYWQLHLAYDKDYNYKTYSDYTEQLSSLFYARMDTYARDASKAPKPGGTALTLSSGNPDQNLMRLACAAAEKDILDFFERWGKVPDADTKAYAAQFEKETRAIYYVSDDSRVYSMTGESSLSTDGTTEAIGEVDCKIHANAANQVDFTFRSANIPEKDVLGYEITRCMIAGGEVEKQVVGFTTDDTWSDAVTSINNRTVYYEIVLVDQYLNRSAVKTLEPIKIEHDGSQDKTGWTISTSGLTADAKTSDATEDTPCAPVTENPAEKAVDQDVDTVYTASVDSSSAEITMEFNKTLVVTGFKYTAGEGTPIGDYEIQIYSGGEWLTAAEGTFGQDKVNTVYFANTDHKYVSTYEADAMKLLIKNMNGSEVSIAELDVLGVTGDNIDFRRTGDTDTALIGRLKSDYKYGQKDEDVIPAGSVIFMGSYKGNPAYNVVLLFDQDGRIVGGTNEEGDLNAQQIILADVPEEGNITNTSDGTWIYWMEPDQITDLGSIQKVRAELYRVNDALTNEGQRLVSDSLFETMPETLPEIELNKESAN